MMHRLSFAVACVAMTACGSFNDKPYLIEDLRIVAIVSDPPEVHVGQVHTFRIIEFKEDVGVGPRMGHHFWCRIETDLLQEVTQAYALNKFTDPLAVLPVLAPNIPNLFTQLIEIF